MLAAITVISVLGQRLAVMMYPLPLPNGVSRALVSEMRSTAPRKAGAFKRARELTESIGWSRGIEATQGDQRRDCEPRTNQKFKNRYLGLPYIVLKHYCQSETLRPLNKAQVDSTKACEWHEEHFVSESLTHHSRTGAGHEGWHEQSPAVLHHIKRARRATLGSTESQAARQNDELKLRLDAPMNESACTTADSRGKGP